MPGTWYDTWYVLPDIVYFVRLLQQKKQLVLASKLVYSKGLLVLPVATGGCSAAEGSFV